MRPTTINLILIELAAFLLIATGGGIFLLSRNLRKHFRLLFQGFARILMVLGFFVIGILFLEGLPHQMGPRQAYLRATPYCLAAVFLLPFVFWWVSRHRQIIQSSRGLISFLGYPVLVISLVIGWHYFVRYMMQSRGHSLDAAILSTEGKIAPEIEFMDSQGQKHKLTEFKGKIVLLNFWATTCGPCVHEMPDLSAIQKKFKERGFVLVYLSSEKPDVLVKFFSTRDIDGIHGRLTPEFPVPPFYQAGEAFPISYLINREGVVKSAWLGTAPPDWAEKKIEKEL
jgi:thiol-disulfide isomerase/thioredoxin